MSRAQKPTLSAPSPFRLLAETRVVGELLTSTLIMPVLRQGPRGDGHPVMVVPGFLAGGVSTRFMRRFLKRVGYNPHCWRMGRNLGVDPGLEHRLQDRLGELRHRYQRKVSLIGWSLGGIYVRMLANASPEAVRTVISMGSPFNQDLKANHAWRLYEGVSGSRIDDMPAEQLARVRNTPPVPTTAIYSRTDGVTAWQCCVEAEGPQAENIAVPGSHLGLGFNPLVLRALVDRLAQPEGGWKPFDRSGMRRILYPRTKAEEALDTVPARD